MFRTLWRASGLIVCCGRPEAYRGLALSALRYCTAQNALDYEAIAGNNEEVLKRLKVLELEVDVHRQDGLKVPQVIKTEQWQELLQLKTRSQRLKQLSFWWLNEIKRANDKRKKEEKKKARSQEKPQVEEDNGHIRYGFQGSTIFLRIYSSKIDAFHNYKLIRAMTFGQNLVMDCSYDQYMSPKEANNCAKQLMISFSENRAHQDPFNLHFCNVNRNSRVMTMLNKIIPTLHDDTFPINMTEKSYLDIFPKDKLVYLTPHCREELTSFNHDDIYIVGAMVDKMNSEPLSLAKAKSEGIRMAKLPLDRYLTWYIGTKSLTINQMMLILLEIKSSGDWKKALTHVPRRKLYNEREHLERDPLDVERKKLSTRKKRQDLNLRFYL